MIIYICDGCGARSDKDASLPISHLGSADFCPKCLDEYFEKAKCCHKCAAGVKIGLNFFRVCPTCGNKRCPKASDHDLACTGSNEPGQPGSVYA